jgi:hypothetical protein
MNPIAIRFEKMVRDYLAGNLEWEAVHQMAVQMEYENQAEFPDSAPLQELHTVFLTADARDDPQFRAERSEIEELLAALDLRREP